MDRGRPPVSRARGRARRALLGLSLLAMLAAAASASIPVVLRPRVESLLSGALGAPVAIGSLSVGPRADLYLRALRMGDPASGPTADEMDVDPDFRRVVRGETVLNRVAVRGLRAALSLGSYGDLVVAGIEPPTVGTAPAGLDVREILLRDARFELPSQGVADGLRLDVERLVVRQVPDATPGLASFRGFFEARLGDVPLRGEGLAQSDGGTRRLEIALAPAPVRFPGATTSPPRSEAARVERVRSLVESLPGADVVLRSGCPPGSGSVDELAKARLDAVRALLVGPGRLAPGAVTQGDPAVPGIPGPATTGVEGPDRTGSGCVGIEVRVER